VTAREAHLVDELSRLALFANLDHDDLDAVVGMAGEATFDEGDWIVRRGEAEVGLYMIVEGEIGVVFEGEELAVLSRGSFFGEISALLGEPTVADVLARAPTRCLVVPAQDVRRFLLGFPLVMLHVLQTEARRLKTADESRA
jgi:CRP/FNR family cyclic AMP-dependent transcriptional regulator